MLLLNIQNIMKRIGLSALMVCMALIFCTPAMSEDTVYYRLEDCRQQALSYNASARSQQELQQAAKYNRQAALAAMFPRVSANGGYMWTSSNMHLVGNELAFSFGQSTILPDGTTSFAWESGAEGILPDAAGQVISDVHKYLYDATTVDLTHVLVAQVGVTQPIYVGGRLTQLYKIAKSNERIAMLKSEADHDETIYKADEAYWRVVTVGKKKELADQYHKLLCQLESDVKEAVAEGLATQSDLLKVTTKRGEADVKKLQAENGLTLSNMALAQVCGLPLSTRFKLDEHELEETSLPSDAPNTEAAVSNRSEMQLMQEAEKIAKSTAMIAAAGLQPNIVAQANYLYSNPNMENGIKSDWKGKGWFSAGVVVNVPIVHADDILRYKAAKHAAKAVALKTEETRELLTLQTTQANQKMMEAQQKIALARLTENNAAEVLRMAQESYEAGMITSSELMQAQTAWLAAATDLIDAQAEAKTTETQLRKYFGSLK